jgi:hypothetical protein
MNGAIYKSNIADQNFLAHVGWDYTAGDSSVLNYLFSTSTLELLSAQISNALRGVDPQGRRIIVPHDKIANVLSSVYSFGTRTNIGDIYTHDTMPSIENRNDVRNILNQTMNIIVSAIKDEIEITEQNKKLSVWTTVLGDFNDHGLRAYAPIKIRERHPQYMAFNMNY